jgi:hypothetical protein
MAVIEIARIQVRRGQENQTGIPQLAGGEFAWAEDTENLYIGLKREDGGARDANIRVLTENDARLFNSFISDGGVNTGTQYVWNVDNSRTITSSTYTSSLPDGNNKVSRTLQNKLDDFVSIADFGVITSTATDAIDCTTAIQTAIDHLFLDLDVYNGTTYDIDRSLRYNKKILFPAGIYRVGGTIFIPKGTVIVGEGIDKTIIENITTGSGVFQTVDYNKRRLDPSLGKFDANTSSGATIITGPGQPANIHIEGMTIRYSTTTALLSHLSLISLDCVDNATIKQVKFQGHHSVETQADAGYTGIDIRGYNEITSDNIVIDNCQFTGLYYDIKSDYDIKHVVIQNNSFKYSKYAIAFSTVYNLLATSGPTYARVINNKFEEIENQGFYVGDNTSGVPTNHVSENNTYIRVGNYGYNETANIGTSIIKFNTIGNASVNDSFSRQIWQNQNFGGNYTYYPLIEGRATIDLNSISTATLVANATSTVMRLPVTGYNQYLHIKYICSGGSIQKIGNLHVYVRPGFPEPAHVEIVDDYNVDLSDGGLYWGVTTEGTYRYFELKGVNPSTTDVRLEMQTKLML